MALPSLSAEFILNPRVRRARSVMMMDNVDFGVWTATVERDDDGDDDDGVGKRTRVLVLGANMKDSEVTIELERLGLSVGGDSKQVLDSGAKLVEDKGESENEGEDKGKKKKKTKLRFTPLGSGGWIFDV